MGGFGSVSDLVSVSGCRWHALPGNPVGYGLGEMDAADLIRSVEIGERACDLQNSMIGAGGEFHLLGCIRQKPASAFIRRCDGLHQSGGALGVVGLRRKAKSGVSLGLHASCFDDAGANRLGGLARLRANEVGGGHGRHVDPQIDPIEKRSGDAGLIIRRASRTPGADVTGFARHPAAAGIHGRDQLHARRIGDAMIGTGNHALAAFEGLAERVEHDGREFREFVEEEHAAMGERHLAGPRSDPPPTMAAIDAE